MVYSDTWAQLAFALTRITGGRGLQQALSLRPTTGLRGRALENHEFTFPSGDPYWSRLRASKFRYEPEVERALRVALPKASQFVDCGANIGYWATFSRNYALDEIIAIEPNDDLHGFLRLNLDGDERVFVISAALVAGDKKSVDFFAGGVGGNHSGSTVREDLAGERELKIVDALTLDEAIGQTAGQVKRRVIKLDVEGTEAEIIEESRLTRSSDTLWIYEDHGNDRTHSASEAFFKIGFHDIFHFQSDRLLPLRLRGIEDVARIKKISHRGYNFVAVPREKRDFWLS